MTTYEYNDTRTTLRERTTRGLGIALGLTAAALTIDQVAWDTDKAPLPAIVETGIDNGACKVQELTRDGLATLGITIGGISKCELNDLLQDGATTVPPLNHKDFARFPLQPNPEQVG